MAETLQGLSASDFVQKDPIYITDANVQKIFGSTGTPADASSLHHHDGRYVQISSSSSQDLGAGGLPHSSLKMKTPKEFLESYGKELYAV